MCLCNEPKIVEGTKRRRELACLMPFRIEQLAHTYMRYDGTMVVAQMAFNMPHTQKSYQKYCFFLIDYRFSFYFGEGWRENRLGETTGHHCRKCLSRLWSFDVYQLIKFDLCNFEVMFFDFWGIRGLRRYFLTGSFICFLSCELS